MGERPPTGLQAADLRIPTLVDVLAARLRIRPYLAATPIRHYPSLSKLVGAEVWVKHENHLPTGAFKVRGGLNLISQLSEDERRRGVITASSGNHGQSIAYAARRAGVRATICVPVGANPLKVDAIAGFGAEIVHHGRDFDDAREHCERLAEERGLRYIHSGNEPRLIAGVATHTLEILEEWPGVDVIVVPIGGGSGAAGACIVAKAVNPGIRVIGVQSDAAPAGYRSWKAGELVEDRMGTSAEGLATRTAFELPQRILRERLDDFVLVSEAEIQRAIGTMLEHTRNLIEGAGAAPLAAALSLRRPLEGARVALIATGGNVNPAQLRDVLREG